MEKEILKTIRYFAFFDYPPSFEEIHTFYPKEIDNTLLKRKLTNLVHKKILVKVKNAQIDRYTLKNKASDINLWKKRFLISQKKINKVKGYIKILSFFPQIKLVGFSGSLAMMNAQSNHDIDLFIVTAFDRLWTGRFIAILLAQIMGIRRKRPKKSYASPLEVPKGRSGELRVTSYKDKVCLNLFFDEKNLTVPKIKKTEYVAHEVLQMKPLVNKDGVYERFIYKNKWVGDYYPNAKGQISISKKKILSKKILNTKYLILNSLTAIVESFLKKLQLNLIFRHRTTELITSTQLWFHPDDFGKIFILTKKVI